MNIAQFLFNFHSYIHVISLLGAGSVSVKRTYTLQMVV